MTTRKATPALYRWRSKAVHSERWNEICLMLDRPKRDLGIAAKVRLRFPDGTEIEASRSQIERVV